MPSKSKIRQQAMKTAARIWELKSGEQLDTVVTLLIDGLRLKMETGIAQLSTDRKPQGILIDNKVIA